MMLSDRTMKEEIAKRKMVVEPCDPACLPTGVDIHPDKKLLVFKIWRHPFYIGVKKSVDDLAQSVEIGEGEPCLLNPGEFVLASIAGYVDSS